ncbi:MAG: PadR family transcriptional regulator [Coprobacillus cateniformis]
MNPKYERQLKKGVLEILVLKLLSQKKMYGYQLIIEMKQLSHEMFTLREGRSILFSIDWKMMVWLKSME